MSTAPGSPTNIKSAMKTTSAVVTWTRPASVGSGLTGYTVTATSSNGGTTRTVSVGPTIISTEITNLTQNKKYTFTVISLGAVNSAASTPTETKISGTQAISISAIKTKASGSDTTALTAAQNIIQFQDQVVQKSNTFTKFKSHSEYLSYLKGKAVLGFN